MSNLRGRVSKLAKRIDYDYDQISGKVNKLTHFYHEYGPLARVEFGTEKVQGLDYSYTIQGWLKAINSGRLTPFNDMGHDGTNLTSFANRTIARDVFGEVLGYYTNDFTAVSSNGGTTALNFDPTPGVIKNTLALYNGNIPQMWDALSFVKNSDSLKARSMLHTYQYDELNRLLGQTSYNYFPDSVGLLNPVDPTQNYLTTFVYDAVGNISKLTRNGYRTSTTPLAMDQLQYSYSPTPNRLSGISDPVSSGNYPTDIDSQSNPSNYVYDATGNLIQDASEGIYNIEWNIANKPVRVSNSDQSRSIACLYDPMGERVVKQTYTKIQVYIRDASGNILAVYSKGIGADTTTRFESSYIYGTARLGELSYKGKTYQPPRWKHDRMRGWRHYELTNHLGNVMAVVTDRKHSIDTDGNYLWNYNLADVASVNDYYPGGMLMPGRGYSGTSSSYRFGFNGKENDNEVKGVGNSLDFGSRIYDSRAVRWMSVDPFQQKYAGLSPYQFCANNPIYYFDPDGKKIVPVTVRAQNSLDNIVNSFSNKKLGLGGADILGLNVGAVDRGKPYESTITEEQFLKNAKRAGIKGEDFENAKAVFKALKSSDIIEIATVSVNESTSTSRTEAQTQQSDFKYNTEADNAQWVNFKSSIDQTTGTVATQGAIDDLINNAPTKGDNYGILPKQSTNDIIVINPDPVKPGEYASTIPKEDEKAKDIVTEKAIIQAVKKIDK